MADFPLIIIARFWSKVSIPTCPHHAKLCWPWTGATAKGYGQMKVGQTLMRAHRMAYEMTGNALAEGDHVLHSCDNPMCCNPAHLRAGSHAENMDEKASRGRAWKGGPRSGKVLGTKKHLAVSS